MAPEELDLRPFTRLHAFVVLRDLIRKWWRLEVFLANARGEPVVTDRDGADPGRDPGEGAPAAPEGEHRALRDPELAAARGASPHAQRPIAPDNDFCRLTLHAPSGARRCGESLRVTLDKLRAAGSRAREQIHECHLGFDLIASPLWIDGELQGCVAVSGSVREPLRAFGEEQLLKRVRALAPDAGAGTDLERALRRVPFLARAEVDQLIDLLRLCADEITSHQAERARGRPVSAAAAEGEALLGTTPAVLQLQRRLERLSAAPANVLLRGGPGTGKALCALLMHQRRRPPGTLQRVSCGVQGEGALTRALFGPAGAVDRASAGGALLLDQVDALPLALQERLALALAQPGSPRVYATTGEGALAPVLPALWDRLTEAEVYVPSLRERRDDLTVLVEHFARRDGGGALRLSEEALAALRAYAWPGNVRELRAEVARLSLLRGPGVLEVPAALLSPRIRAAEATRRGSGGSAGGAT